MERRDRISIAIVGAGQIGVRHAQSVVACEDTILLCLIDPVFATESTAGAFEVPLFDTVTAMLQQCTPDAAIVCTPNSTHVEVSKELLSSGVDVLVEKPIAIDSSSGDRLVKYAQACGRQLLVGHHRRFNPYITATKKALDDGVIGSPVAVSGLWMLYKPVDYFEYPTEWRASQQGGGPILINMIHEVDILQYLLGPIARVHAEQTIRQRAHEAEEGTAVLLRFASGVVGTFILCDSTPSKHNFESSTGENPMIPQAGADCYRLFGTGGTLSVGDMKVAKPGEKSWSSPLAEYLLPISNVVPFDEQIKHFARVVRGIEKPRCRGTDGLRALRVCEAIKEASNRGVAIDIEI